MSKIIITCFIMGMQISSNISFKANYLSTVQIKKLDSLTKAYNGCQANFVELVSKKDIEVLRWISKHWKAIFATGILGDACNKLPKNEYYPNSSDNSRFYALTIQKNSFEELLPDKVLGLAEVTDGFWEDVYNLDYLQTKPAYKYKSIDRKYKNIGTEIINQIKKICSDKTIMLVPKASAKDFYLKNDFIFVNSAYQNMMFWEKGK